jgi:Fe-S cluster biogenesis protein NfuA
LLKNYYFYTLKKYKMSLTEQVEQALETIRPYLIADGGNVAIEEITPEYVVKLRLLGNCGSCKMSFMTMKAGIEQAIMKAVPEITGVVAVDLAEQD